MRNIFGRQIDLVYFECYIVSCHSSVGGCVCVCVPAVLVLTILFTQYFVYVYYVVDIVLLQLTFFPFYFSFQSHVDKVI